MAARYPEGVGASDPSSDGATTHLGHTLDPHAAPDAVPGSVRPPPAAAFARDVTVCVLSLDPELIDMIRRSGGDRHALCVVQSWPELIAKIEAADCGVAVLDTAALENRVAKRIADLQAYSDRLVTLVAAERRDAEDLVGDLSSRKIHRLLIKPAAAGITRLLLESAVIRYLQLLGRPDAQLDSTGTHFVPLVSSRQTIPERWVIGVALLVAASIAGLAWIFWPDLPSASSSAATSRRALSPPPPIEQPADRFAQLIASAERAFAEGRLTEPSGDNALDYYLTIAAADPTHRLAQERLAEVVQALFTQAESALLADSTEAAAAILASVRRADPESPRLAFLEAQLARARRDDAGTAGAAALPRTDTSAAPSPVAARAVTAAGVVAAEVAPEGASPARAAPTELESLLTIARARIARKQLLEPAGDGAVHYLERAVQTNGADPAVRAASGELASAATAAARAALRDGDVEAASRLLGAVQRFSTGESVAKLAADVAAARTADWLARAQARLRAGALIAPEEDSALRYLTLLEVDSGDAPDVAAAWRKFATQLVAQVQTALNGHDWAEAESAIAALERSGRDPANTASLRRTLVVERTQESYLAVAVPASELTVLRYPPPEYPAEAQRRGIEGWVDLEFVVDKTGTPRDLTAVASDPPQRFERAAIDAVSQYRYEPFGLDGESYERRVRLRLNFELR